MSIHHGTIRKYTSALLDLFNGLEIQYNDSLGVVKTKSIPIVYTSREKARILEGKTAEQLSSGNFNVLPRACLSLDTMVKSNVRTKNKNLKINTVANANTFEYMYNSVPYEFTFELTIMCRGMNEATMIIEQIAPKFNPTYNVDIWEASNLSEPTRVPVSLLEIGIETSEYEELSSNIVTVSIGLSLMGNLYPPIQTIQRVKDFKMYINEQNGSTFNKKSILGWDVNSSGALVNGTITDVVSPYQYAPVLVDIVPTGTVHVGQTVLSVIYSDKDNKITELTFNWVILQGPATIAHTVTETLDKALLTVTATGTVEVQVTVTDPHGNYAILSKIFTV